MLKIDTFGLTDVGRVREVNEDQFLIANLTKSLQMLQSSLEVSEEASFSDAEGHLYVVADGMGGREAGERASAVAVCSLADSMLNTLRWHFRSSPRREPEVMADLKDALLRCQQQIGEEARLEPSTQGMGTTVTVAYLLWPRMFVVHVGDSRCYLLRDGQLRQLTRDHSWAQLLVEAGRLSADEARTSRYQHMLWNVVGGENDEIEPDVFREEMEFGDAVLLCTDGLNKHLADDEIAAVLRQNRPAEELCRQLVAAANDAGGSDNVTVVVARFPMTLQHNQHASCVEVAHEGVKTTCEFSPTLAE
jgi:serine/threonine protein phosphatase PrpC